MQGSIRTFALSLKSDSDLRLSLEGTDTLTVQVPADETLLQRVYVTAPAGSAAAHATRTELRLLVQDVAGADRVSSDTFFNGAPQN